MPRIRQSKGANTSFFAFQDIITSVTGILILVVILLILMLRQPGLIVEPVDPKETRSLGELTGLLEKVISEIRKLAAMDLEIGKESEEELNKEIARLEEEIKKGIDPLRMGLIKEIEAARSEFETLQKEETTLVENRSTAEEKLAEAEEIRESMKQEFEDNLDSSQVWLSMRRGDKKPIVIELNSAGGIFRDLIDVEKKLTIPESRLEGEVRKLARRNDSGKSYFVFFIRPSGIKQLEPLKKLLVSEGFGIGYRALEENTELRLLPEELEGDTE